MLEGEWNDQSGQAEAGQQPAVAPATPPAAVAGQPVWRGQSPAYPVAVPQQPSVGQPIAPPQGGFQVPVVQQQPAQAWPVAQPVAQPGWGGAPLAPTAPTAVDYSRMVAPQAAPVYTVQQPVAPGFPGMMPPASI